MKIQVSHGAPLSDDRDDVAWFVVLPAPGSTGTSGDGAPVTNERAVASLRDAGRTVIELDVEPWMPLQENTG
jgi:hypothetical protein